MLGGKTELDRDIKIDIINGKYKATSAYKIPDNPDMWMRCPNCGLIPLIWVYNNGRSTACGCGKDNYNHFSICSESIMSSLKRGRGHNNYDSDKLRKNWNHWVQFGEDLEPRDELLKNGKW